MILMTEYPDHTAGFSLTEYSCSDTAHSKNNINILSANQKLLKPNGANIVKLTMDQIMM